MPRECERWSKAISLPRARQDTPSELGDHRLGMIGDSPPKFRGEEAGTRCRQSGIAGIDPWGDVKKAKVDPNVEPDFQCLKCETVIPFLCLKSPGVFPGVMNQTRMRVSYSPGPDVGVPGCRT